MNRISKIKGLLKTYEIKGRDIARLAGVEPPTVRVVLGGYGGSPKVRKATIALLRSANPAAASEVELLWPEGKRLAA